MNKHFFINNVDNLLNKYPEETICVFQKTKNYSDEHNVLILYKVFQTSKKKYLTYQQFYLNEIMGWIIKYGRELIENDVINTEAVNYILYDKFITESVPFYGVFSKIFDEDISFMILSDLMKEFENIKLMKEII